MNEKEREVKAVIREMLKDKEGLETTLKTAVKFMNKALKSSGLELKENCLFILGNSIYWNGTNYAKIKNKLRKFAFNSAVGNRSKTELKGR